MFVSLISFSGFRLGLETCLASKQASAHVSSDAWFSGFSWPTSCWCCTAWRTQPTWRWGKDVQRKRDFLELIWSMFANLSVLFTGAPKMTHVRSVLQDHWSEMWPAPNLSRRSAPPRWTSCSWRPIKPPAAPSSTSSSDSGKSTSSSSPSPMAAMTSSTHRLSCAPRLRTTQTETVSTLFATTCASTTEK